MYFRRMFFLLILTAALCATAQSKIEPLGLQSLSIKSLSFSKTPAVPAPVLVAASADSGVYYYYLGMDCGWQNLGLRERNIRDVFVRTEGVGPSDYYKIFAGMRQSATDSTLIYSYKIDLDSSWTAADSGMPRETILQVDDMDGLGYSGNEPPHSLFAAAYGSLFRYDGSWQEIPFEGPFAEFVNVYSDSLIWCGGSGMAMGPLLYKSTNEGQSWIQMDDTLCTFGCDNACRSLAIVPQHPDTVYLGMDGHVLKSIDGGLHWQATGLKDIQAGFFGIAADPLMKNHLVTFSRADTSIVYESFDGGLSWTALPNPVASFKINEMSSAVFEQEFMVFFASEQGVYVYKKPPDHISPSTENSIPQTFVLEQNHPNPFNPTTTIHFQLPSADYIDLTIYNLLGQKIRTLASGRKEAGKYKVAFNAAALPSGVYYYKLSVGNRLMQARKMLLLR